MTNATFRAAAGKVPIPVKKGDLLLGYGDKNFANVIHGGADDLYARILVLDQPNPSRRCVIVSLDAAWATEKTVTFKPVNPNAKEVTILPTLPEGTRTAWAAAAGVQDRDLTLNATHTHYAPALTLDCRNKITEQIRLLSQPDQLKPVALKVGVGPCNRAVARRIPSAWPGDRHPEGISIDRTLIVLSLVTEDNQQLAWLVNYGVHPTDLNPPLCQSSSHLVGQAMTRLEGVLGGPKHALFLQGFSGDLGPNKDVPVKRPNGEWDFNFDHTEMTEYARRFERDILEVQKNSHAVPSLPLRTAQSTFSWSGVPWVSSGIALGDVVILSLSGEIFNQYGPLLTRLRPTGHTLSCGVANGYSGYVPTDAAFDDPFVSYEINVTPYRKGIEADMMAAMKHIFDELQRGAASHAGIG